MSSPSPKSPLALPTSKYSIALSTRIESSSPKIAISVTWFTLKAARPLALFCSRFPTSTRQAKPATLVEAVAAVGSRLQNSVTVVEPGRVRVSSVL